MTHSTGIINRGRYIVCDLFFIVVDQAYYIGLSNTFSPAMSGIFSNFHCVIRQFIDFLEIILLPKRNKYLVLTWVQRDSILAEKMKVIICVMPHLPTSLETYQRLMSSDDRFFICRITWCILKILNLLASIGSNILLFGIIL